MRIAFRRFEPKDLPAIVALSLRAWAPVFPSIRESMGADVFDEQTPDWRVSQTQAVEATCNDESVHTWVAIVDDTIAGFMALRFHREDRMGEIYMIAVDPAFQRKGIGAELTHQALDILREAGMTTVMVETGGDPGHAPARATYEAAGFRFVSVARYFKKLGSDPISMLKQ